MLKQKITGSVQEVILPDFPDDDDNTVTTTVTKSRRVSFGPNFVKEFIVDSAISAQCMPEYEQPFPSSDSSNADSTHGTFLLQENLKLHKSDSDAAENRPKPPKFASTICFSADSPTADMEFTEGCITLAKSILDKKNKEMTVIIQAKPKGPKEEEKAKEEETNYFEGSQFEMSTMQCFKSKEKKRFAGEKTKIFGKYDDEMSVTRCERFFTDEDEDEDESKENRMPLDAIMRYLDKNESDSDLFNPEKSFGPLLGVELSDESEKLDLNESMELSEDLNIAVGSKASEVPSGDLSENEPRRRFGPLRSSDDGTEAAEHECSEEMKIAESPKGGCLDVSEQPIRLGELSSEEMAVEEMMGEEMVSEKMRTEEIVFGRLTAQEMVLKKIRSGEMVSEKTRTEEMLAEKMVFQKIIHEEMVVEQMVSEKTIADKIPSEKILAEKMVIQEKTPEKMSTEKMVGEEMVCEGITSEDMIGEKMPSENIIPEKMPSENIIPEKMPTENIIPEKMPTENIMPKGTAAKTRTEEMLVEKIACEKMVIEKIMVEEIVAEKMLSHKIIAENMVDQEKVPEKMSTEKIIPEMIPSEKIRAEELAVKKTRTEKMVAEEMLTEKMASEKMVTEEMITEKVITEETAAKKTRTGEVTPDKMIAEEMLREKITPEDMIHEKMVSEKIILEETAAKKTGTEEMLSEKMVAEEMVCEKVITEGIVAEKMITQEKVPKEMPIPEVTAAKKTRTGEVTPDKMIAEEMLREKITPEDMIHEKMVSEKIILEETAAKKTRTEEMVAEEMITNDMIGEKMLSEEMVTDKITSQETLAEETLTEDLMDIEPSWNPSPFTPKPTPASQGLTTYTPPEDDTPTEPTLGDLKVIESLKEQAEEKGCVWTLRDVKHPRKRSQGLLSFGCRLLDSTTSLQFSLKMSDEDTLDCCCLVTDSSILLDEEDECRVPEYTLAVGFGYRQLQKHFGALQGVTTLRHVPYYMDRVNSFLSKMNAYLRQIQVVLTSYPGSRLQGCQLSFRLFSFPVFLSCVVSIDLRDVFRLSRASLSFEHDFGCLDERKVGEIFEESLKEENSLCEFVVRATRYLVEQERVSGYLSKRRHIRLLPEELKS